MQGHDAHHRACGKFQSLGIGLDILHPAPEGDLNLARTGEIARNPNINGAAVVDRFGQDGRPVGTQLVERVHQREVNSADHHADPEAAQRGNAHRKSVFFEDCSSKPKTEQHTGHGLDGNNAAAAAVASRHIDAAAGTGVSIMTNEHAKDRLKDNQNKAKQPDGPKELRGKRLVVPQTEDGSEMGHYINLGRAFKIGQGRSKAATQKDLWSFAVAAMTVQVEGQRLGEHFILGGHGRGYHLSVSALRMPRQATTKKINPSTNQMIKAKRTAVVALNGRASPSKSSFWKASIRGATGW